MGQFPRSQYMVGTTPVLTSGAGMAIDFYFPRAARILRYAVVPAVAQAAHASVVVTGEFTNAGTGGAGSTVLATFTNDSDLADSIVRKSGAWVAHDALEIITNNRPASPTNDENSWDEIAAGSVIKYIPTSAGSTPTASQHTALIEFVESD